MTSLRARLASTLAFLLFVVLTLSTALLWSTTLARNYFAREQHAHERLAAYLELSSRMYAERLRTENSMLTGMVVSLADIDLFRSAQARLFDELKLGLDDVEGQRELERAARVQALIAELTGELAQAIEAYADRRVDAARGAISLLARRVDQELWPLIELAVQSERDEIAELARLETSLVARVSATTAAAASIAVLLAAFTGYMLFRSITQPMQGLVRATEHLAAGRLDSRVALEGPTEFAQLAVSFNRMAGDIEAQTTRLEDARSTLEQRVQARTAALKRKNLQLRRADRSRREFFADVSHELRTPLTLIRGEAELALEHAEDLNGQGSAVRRILDLAKQMGALVEDMLFLARSEASSAPAVHLGPLDLRALVEEARAAVQGHFERTHRRLSISVPEDDCPMLGDAQRLRQLLRILLDNALQYTRDGDAVEVALSRESGSLRLEVIDTGPGIEATELKHIFKRFYRGADARRFNATGSGLGLSVARSIVQAHAGSIEARSVPQRGTTFAVQLPHGLRGERA